MRSIQHLGKRIRALRLREGLSQTAMAERLGVSASYLNLIEHDRRPLSANLLIRLSQFAGFDMKSFAEGEDTKLAATLMEVFGARLGGDPGRAGARPPGPDRDRPGRHGLGAGDRSDPEVPESFPGA